MSVLVAVNLVLRVGEIVSYRRSRSRDRTFQDTASRGVHQKSFPTYPAILAVVHATAQSPVKRINTENDIEGAN
jgi:hypothetical protein